MGDLHAYQFPARPAGGVLFGLSVARLAALGAAGIVFIAAMARPTPTSLSVGAVAIGLLATSAAVKVGGRAAIDWIPIWVGYGFSQATRNNEFYSSPDLTGQLPDGMLDLPGGLFGIELHSLQVPSAATVANPTPVGYGIIADTFRHRLVAIAELAGPGFLFLDPPDQQALIGAWGGVLDHLAQSLPELARLQLVHTVGPASTEPLLRHHRRHGGRGTDTTTDSYAELLAASKAHAQEHRLLLAIGLDRRLARRAIRQAGGGTDGAAQVLMDRAATIEDALAAAGVDVHGWLPARAVAGLLRAGFDPASRATQDDRPDDVNDGGRAEVAAASPAGMVDGWSTVRHDSGWSATLQIVRPPSRPVAGDFLQHLLIGVPAERRLSILYVPMPMAAAERQAQTAQVATESEQHVRARLGFATTARQRRHHDDAARREADLVEGRAVYQVVWLVTVTGPTPAELDTAIGQVEAAARRCSLELRRLAGTQRQAFGFTLPLCRGAR